MDATISGPVGMSWSSAMPETGTTITLSHPIVDQPSIRVLTVGTSVVFV